MKLSISNSSPNATGGYAGCRIFQCYPECLGALQLQNKLAYVASFISDEEKSFLTFAPSWKGFPHKVIPAKRPDNQHNETQQNSIKKRHFAQFYWSLL